MTRTPFQGVINIIRFNWHFYLAALLSIVALYIISVCTDSDLVPKNLYLFLIYSIGFVSFISLFVSYYVYDASGLYQLDWVKSNNKEQLIINIHAGFDETSELLQEKFKHAHLEVLDFYDPQKHTEISIERARKAYPAFPDTKAISTSQINMANDVADKIFVLFAAHEIRNDEERIRFFEELKRIVKPDGKIYIMEHLRDCPNFLAYQIGFFHFYGKAKWKEIFAKSQLHLQEEIKFTHFVSIFILSK